MAAVPPPTTNPDDAPTGSLVRDRLANERTFLAWLRTAANVMIVGLAIARFGDGGDVTGASLAAGALLVVTGAAGVVYGAARYRRLDHALTAGEQLPSGAVGPMYAAIVLAAALVAAVIVLVAASR